MANIKIPITKPTLPKFDSLKEEVREILESGMLTNYKHVREFESMLKAKLNVKNVVALSSCTSGLMLCMKAWGLTGEVILPSFTFSATGHAIKWNNLTPVFVEVDPITQTIDPAAVEAAITDKTSAILGVHLYGCPAKIKELEAIAKKHNLKLIFDAAHAMGSTYDGKAIGNFGDAEVFSCSPTKLLVTTEGGIVCTNDDELAKTLRYARNYGDPGDYNCKLTGINARMTEFNAIVGKHSLAMLNNNVLTRNRLVQIYKELLQSIPGITYQTVPDNCVSSFKDFALFINSEIFGCNRDILISELLELGIQSKPYFYPPLHEQDAYQEYSQIYQGKLDLTEKVSRETISLPLYSHMPTEEIIQVVAAVKQIHHKYKQSPNHQEINDQKVNGIE
ncbi:DegT/DnrJ/EryC1/StrS family aminotransferase [archaeon]|jgi:dTDP-4-amino-4,6-dideoxygalactose transaminase|nr:DegT/DnrJ/EryC1/StrS family aminotransferase [archaeon]MBT6762377.1 DegT/DnrJ/EryC1/StrS family aminotransferase [archaeon]